MTLKIVPENSDAAYNNYYNNESMFDFEVFEQAT